MMKTIDISDQIRECLEGMGLSVDAAARVTACIDSEETGSDGARETIALGYPVVKKGYTSLKDVAVTNMAAGGITKMLDDQAKLATFLDSGMRATPAAKRLALPAWVAENSNAARNAADMDRASNLAVRAAIGEAASLPVKQD